VHPHRNHPSDHASATPGEELILYAALCVIGAIPVATVLVCGGSFGVEATIGLMMALAGVAGLLAARSPDRHRLR
jgi:predicted phage tail protein